MGNTVITTADTSADTSGNTIQKNPIREEPRTEEKSINNNIKQPDTKLMEKIEKEGMDKVAGLWEKGTPFDINSLINIMKEGTEEFKKKEGRNMTYAEMRSLYG